MKRLKSVDINTLDVDKTFLEVDSQGWREPQYIPLRSVLDAMDLTIPPAPNVKLVTFEDQDISVNRPPNTYGLDHPLHLSVDENFLYVWINERWKRVPLSEF
jgi:hypothetical protein